MLSPEEVLDTYFLDARCMLVELAATLDRHEEARRRSNGPADVDPRLEKLYESLGILADRTAGVSRAERLLNLFSDPA